MKFIDLFAGLGGFHLALGRLGHTCVFACEIDDGLAKLYEKNFGVLPAGDIRGIDIGQIPEHDILCAGFPCQPFSKAGAQEGFDHPDWGDLFDYVLKILEAHKPTFCLLENVPNLEKHDGGKTWQAIKSRLRELGYNVREKKLSPHQFGIPQIRERLFIVASRSSLATFRWPRQQPGAKTLITDALEEFPSDARELSPQLVKCLSVWQEFLEVFPKDVELPSFPIWSMEFGATYPFEDTTPFALGMDALDGYLGNHGAKLAGVPPADRPKLLPSHALRREATFPRWKVQFIRQNRELYRANKGWIERWMPKILEFPPSWQKLEWNCKGDVRDIWAHIVQIRASGVRVKRPTTAPSLIAMNTTQVPIIAWQRRYMTARECATLQSLEDLAFLPEVPTHAFRALGNAVNADLVQMIAQSLTDGDHDAAEMQDSAEQESLWAGISA